MGLNPGLPDHWRLWLRVSCSRHSLDRVKVFKIISINRVNFFVRKWWWVFVYMSALVRALLNVSMFLYVLLLARIYIRILPLYTGMHLSYTSVVCYWEGVRGRKEVWEWKCGWRGGGGTWIVAIRMIFFLLIWSNFMRAKRFIQCEYEMSFFIL